MGNAASQGTVLPGQQGGAGRAVTQGSLPALQQNVSQGIYSATATGGLQDVVPQFEALSQAANVDFGRRQAQLRERAGSMGSRFSSQLGRQEGELAQETSLGVLSQLLPSFNQATEGAANRRQQAIFQGVPGIFNAIGGALGQDVQQRQQAAQFPLQYAGQFAPLGTDSQSKSRSINMHGQGGVTGGK